MWTELPDSPKSFSAENAFFLYQNKLFVIDIDSTLWEYTISSDTWTTVSTYPGGLGQGYGMGHVIGNKAYIGLYQRNSEIWELDLNSMSWKSKNNIPGLAQEITVAHFERDGFLYIMRMPDITIAGSYPMNLYKFDPNGF
jgi:N-acetylneuraminic acid mutarotase